MSNIWNLFSDYENKYQNWLKNETNTNWYHPSQIKSAYQQSGIDERLQQAQTGLLGEQRWDPSGTKRVGGVMGEGGSLSTAGGEIKDYVSGKEQAVSPPSTYGSTREEVARPGFKGSEMDKDIHKGLDYGIEKFDKYKNIAVAKGNEWLDGKKEPVVNTEYKDAIRRGGKGANVPNDLNWWQKLSGMFNSKFDLEGAKASWTAKGGFEGLMANPAFTMGLAFMQSAAEGKSLGAGALDNVIKAGGISHTYKKIIEDRKQEPIQATSTDIAEVKGLLETMNIEDPSWIENIFGKVFKKENKQAMFDMAAEDIANALQIEMQKLQETNKGKTPLVFGIRLKLKILKRLEKEGKIKKKGGGLFTAATLETDVPIKTRATGGPVQAGQPYIVGEKGPEVVVPNANATVVSNDDSQIMSMLLSSNPQLQNVSRTRAEAILRSRFPDYFA
jgi:hypothetical protein